MIQIKRHNIYIIIIVFFVISCSPNKKILHFFFDGVPDSTQIAKNEMIKSAKIDSSSVQNNLLAKNNTAQSFSHLPYKEGNCENCHDKSSMGKFVEEQPELCYQCHENFKTKFAFIHGPVSGGFCTACHSPHSAKYDKMILRDGQKLCTMCHDIELVLKNENHSGIGDTKCTECHNPHGGTDKYILN